MSPQDSPASAAGSNGGDRPDQILQSVLERATGWDDALDRLAGHGLSLEPVQPRGVRVHHGDRATPLSKLLPDLRLGEVEQRFGETLRDAVARRAAGDTEAAPTAAAGPAAAAAGAVAGGVPFGAGAQGTQGTARYWPATMATSVTSTIATVASSSVATATGGTATAACAARQPAQPGGGSEPGGDGRLHLSQTFPIEVLENFAEPMSFAERYQLVGQCELLLKELYSHLPLKQAMFAIDPDQELALIRQRLESYEDDFTFFRDVVEVFTKLHDLHTLFELPNPWRQMTAFLPFQIAQFWAGGQPQYCVTRIREQAITESFRPGVILTHWNGVPIHRHVRDFGHRTNGANPAAQVAQAVSHMTVRPLMFMLPPRETWVTLTYLDAQGTTHEHRLPWQVVRVPPSPAAAEARQAATASTTALGVDGVGSAVKEANEWLFEPGLAEAEHTCAREQVRIAGAAAQGAVPPQGRTWMPRQLDFAELDSAYGKLGYLRIKSFEVQNIDAFVAEVARILRLLPPNGLIVDLRGNPGGMIPAGEKILQFLTDARIVPAPLAFRNSNLVRHLVNSVDWLQDYRRGADLSVSTGQVFTQGFGIIPEDEANAIGRIYPGRSVLLIDALVYSTGDFFTAGYKDARIGPVIGVAPRTGAGGGNVWTYSLLENLYRNVPNSPFAPLPRGASMRAAVRRSTRVGAAAGLPVEGLGVEADLVYYPTYQDVMFGDRGLIDYAAAALAGSA